ncbi:NmrA family NAD(P)-binding protein [Roseivirga pacifica]|uniref:NmrA family NAD(P)-binding protein n=1 Tax=Roseivirga pacifica TaxID=1267423 RepID=UPI003BB0F482
MKKQILVIGASGKTGSPVANLLKKEGHEVRNGGRSENPSFDWQNPETFAAALEGMDAAYITYYPDLAVPGAKEAIAQLTEAAKQAGVNKLVLLSGKGEKEAEACEQIIASSGLNYSLVRASWFNQNFSESFLLDPILAGHVALPMPEAEIPFVDANDIAEVAVKALLNDKWNGRTLTVTGSERLTFKQVTEHIAEAIDKPIVFQAVSIEAYRDMMKEAGLPDDYVWLFSYLFKEVLGNAENQSVSHDIEEVLGRKATSFETYVKATAATGVWSEPAVMVV